MLCLGTDAYHHIFTIFNKEAIRYVCVVNETDNSESMPHLDMQIFSCEENSIYTPFMDKLLGL